MTKKREKTDNEKAYDAANPIFSCRVSQQLLEAEDKLQKATGLNRRGLLHSLYLKQNQVFEAAIEKKVNERIEVIRPQLKEEGRKIGEASANKQLSEDAKTLSYGHGFLHGRNQYAFSFPCRFCGQLVYIKPDCLDAVQFKEYLEKQGVCHPHCLRIWKLQNGLTTWHTENFDDDPRCFY